MPRPTIDEYRQRLRAMANRELVAESGQRILGAAVMARMRHNDGWDDDCADVCYEEARCRDNVDLYQRGFNSAVRSQGHHSLSGPVVTPIDHGDPALVLGEEHPPTGEDAAT